MSSFSKNMAFEESFSRRFFRGLRSYLSKKDLYPGRNTRTGSISKRDVEYDLQTTLGDFIVYKEEDGTMRATADLKVERSSSPNLFFEIWSNSSCDPARAKLGWGKTIKADEIWYAFEDAGVVARIQLKLLRAWLDEVLTGANGRSETRLDGFKKVAQTRYEQKNRTVGHLVPFAAMPEAVFPVAWIIGPDGELRDATPQEFMDAAAAARKQKAAEKAA